MAEFLISPEMNNNFTHLASYSFRDLSKLFPSIRGGEPPGANGGLKIESSLLQHSVVIFKRCYDPAATTVNNSKTKERQLTLSDLPECVETEIMLYLKVSDLISARLISKTWRRLVNKLTIPDVCQWFGNKMRKTIRFFECIGEYQFDLSPLALSCFVGFGGQIKVCSGSESESESDDSMDETDYADEDDIDFMTVSDTYADDYYDMHNDDMDMDYGDMFGLADVFFFI
eukprot:CAMPEP_0172523612 /NCGR_PEP_ID=MMETSP1066-20121228/293751_1 /TAXON_ID=671091 /ORGANISM="Coscinodiscus wailesii, Strain CCMP2513" /LENGTH=228 /DNA_ID=CAMNT_0013306695 /DNA_START=541 /DNA_END=1227 /DNA_ORIENTATION=-